MGGNIKNKMGAQKLNEAQIAAREAEKKQKEKKSLIVRVAIAAVVFAVAAVACVFMLKHNFNADREILQGTYYAETRFIYEAESGSDVSDIHKSFIAVFHKDGRLRFIYDTSTSTYYYDYKESAEGPFDGVLQQYAEGVLTYEKNIILEENGDMTMQYVADSVTFTVPQLVQCFGEADTLSMLRGVYNDEICSLLIAEDYDSFTDEQITAMGVEREQLAELAFALKDLSAVMTLYKISDDELTRANALEVWNAQFEVSSTDTVSATDE